jgi:hypothetical protein
VLRFALLITNDPARSGWEIYLSDCPDVMKMVRLGAFAQILTVSSAVVLRQTVLGIPTGDGRTLR